MTETDINLKRRTTVLPYRGIGHAIGQGVLHSTYNDNFWHLRQMKSKRNERLSLLLKHRLRVCAIYITYRQRTKFTSFALVIISSRYLTETNEFSYWRLQFGKTYRRKVNGPICLFAFTTYVLENHWGR